MILFIFAVKLMVFPQSDLSLAYPQRKSLGQWSSSRNPLKVFKITNKSSEMIYPAIDEII